MSTYREQGEETKKKNEEATLQQAETDKAEINTQIDQLIAKAETNAAAQQRTVESDYRDLIDTVAVQRELDRRQISEAMANMGLTKSGLNATQQTAVQLSAGNKTAAAQRQRQAAVDALTQSLVEYKMEVENNRRESINAIDSAAQKNIAEYNAAVDKNVADAEVAAIKADAELVEAQNKRNSSNASTLLTMAKNGAIGWNTYAYAVDNGLTPSQALAVQNSAVDTPSVPDGVSGDSNWSWSTTAYRKSGADTNNWGKFLGFIGDAGIDEDDTVEFYDEAGHYQMISLGILKKNLMAEGMSESDAETFVNRFNKDTGENTKFFITANGKRSYTTTVDAYAKEAYTSFGKDGVLAELETAYDCDLITSQQYYVIADQFRISDDDIKKYRQTGSCDMKASSRESNQRRAEAYNRYKEWGLVTNAR